MAHRLSEEELQRILLISNKQEFAAVPLGQIVLILTDSGRYTDSEHNFYIASTTIVRLTGLPEPGNYRSREQCHGSRRQVRIMCGAGPSLTCPPPSAVCGSTICDRRQEPPSWLRTRADLKSQVTFWGSRRRTIASSVVMSCITPCIPCPTD